MDIYRKPPLQQIPGDIASASDYEPHAREGLSEAAFAYLTGGAADELTLAENVSAFKKIRLRNKVLTRLEGGRTALELFGQHFSHPIMVAPVAFQKLAHPDGEMATVMAASALGAGMVVSTQASMDLAVLAREAVGPLWFQLYIQPDRDFTKALVRRAEEAGYKALVVTVDAPVHGLRNREQRAGFAMPAGIEPVNLQGMKHLPPYMARAGESPVFGGPLVAAAPDWDDLRDLVASTRLPVLVKGLSDAGDAERAIGAGVAGIIVSNHGGRTLDTLPATIEMLPEVVQAVGGRVPVLMDGGIRRGSDVLKALALGAKAVLVGRPVIWGLAAAGAPGVAHVLHMLRAELEVAMALTGCRTLGDIDERVLW